MTVDTDADRCPRCGRLWSVVGVTHTLPPHRRRGGGGGDSFCVCCELEKDGRAFLKRHVEAAKKVASALAGNGRRKEKSMSRDNLDDYRAEAEALIQDGHGEGRRMLELVEQIEQEREQRQNDQAAALVSIERERERTEKQRERADRFERMVGEARVVLAEPGMYGDRGLAKLGAILQPKELRRVRLIYFKRGSGKYYASAVHYTAAPEFYAMVQEVRQLMADKRLPELVGGADEFSVLIEGPGRWGVPHLISPGA